jgi:hypothetical protein
VAGLGAAARHYPQPMPAEQPEPTRERLVIAMIADVPADGIEIFQEYERRVLPLLGRHHGRLERRLRAGDAQVEIHLVSFASRQGYESYLADPERVAHRHLLDPAPPTQRILEMTDVDVAP